VLTVLSETLQQRSDDHEKGANHDRPTPSVLLVEPRSKWNCNDRTELVAGTDESQNTRFNVPLQLSLTVLGLIAVAKVLVERLRELQRADQLRVETGGHLYTHTTQEQP
jgi:hypothetical protein